jgi:hypothetical protein
MAVAARMTSRAARMTTPSMAAVTMTRSTAKTAMMFWLAKAARTRLMAVMGTI